MPTWICPHCLDRDEQTPKEFATEEEYKAHMALHKGKTVNLEPPKAPEAKEEPKAETIKLEYRYKGQCPNCRTEVETIKLDTEKKTKSMVIAWCPSCKETRGQREVVSL
jgi:hypothetical protein